VPDVDVDVVLENVFDTTMLAFNLLPFRPFRVVESAWITIVRDDRATIVRDISAREESRARVKERTMVRCEEMLQEMRSSRSWVTHSPNENQS
jgi:hypothetical protein